MRARAALIVLALGVAGCQPDTQAAPPSANPRIVSLAPSLTEIAFAIGCGPKLVADTTFDDYPTEAARLPHVADVTHVDLERLAKIAPTTVIALHDQETEGGPIARTLPNVSVIYLPNRRLPDLYADIDGVGEACGSVASAHALVLTMQREIGAIATREARVRPKPRVLYLLGLPGYVAGTQSYLSDLISIAGGVNAAQGVDEAYPDLDAEAILAADPDVLVVAHDVPFGADVRSREPWRSLRAVHDGAVVSPPNDDIIERPGPRIIQGLRWLATALHSRAASGG
ncbi:MAG TPA: helical backbone metal receptor [Candidatus Eremiobacteraceae bacterium]|nr:helical backbone metal receptor [Candidatus Eremiobacteraceae bacterium]